MSSVIILGNRGRFGRHATTAFADAGWRVTTFGRAKGGSTHVQGDATDADVLSRACEGQDVIVNALNPPYPDWPREMPRLTRAVIAAARASGARVVIPGNVYNYGAGMPDVLSEQTPWRPSTRKGQLRVAMEQSYRAAEVPTLIVRSGDFFERAASGNWWDGYMMPHVHKGRMVYPGPLDLAHAWAYLPDMARATVLLASRPLGNAPFQEVSFTGYTMTGRELAAHVEAGTGKTQKVTGVPWGLLRVLGWVRPLMREVHEMRYLWQVPHSVSGARFDSLLPDFNATPVAQAVANSLPVGPSG